MQRRGELFYGVGFLLDPRVESSSLKNDVSSWYKIHIEEAHDDAELLGLCFGQLESKEDVLSFVPHHIEESVDLLFLSSC